MNVVGSVGAVGITVGDVVGVVVGVACPVTIPATALLVRCRIMSLAVKTSLCPAYCCGIVQVIEPLNVPKAVSGIIGSGSER